MENKTSSKSIIINYGLIMGVASLLPSLVKYAMGDYLSRDWISGTVGLLISIVFIVIGVKKYKELNGGFVSWGKSVKIGMGMTLISLIITIIYILVFSNFIEPDFKNQVIERTRQQWVDAGMADDVIEQQLPYVRDYFALSMYGGIIIISAFFGFVISAIVGAVMKRSEEDQY